MSALLDVRGLSIAFPRATPVRDVSLTVEPGETLAIVGYTGAGKSTVGSLLARLWDPQRGEIRQMKAHQMRAAGGGI